MHDRVRRDTSPDAEMVRTNRSPAFLLDATIRISVAVPIAVGPGRAHGGMAVTAGSSLVQPHSHSVGAVDAAVKMASVSSIGDHPGETVTSSCSTATPASTLSHFVAGRVSGVDDAVANTEGDAVRCANEAAGLLKAIHTQKGSSEDRIVKPQKTNKKGPKKQKNGGSANLLLYSGVVG